LNSADSEDVRLTGRGPRDRIDFEAVSENESAADSRIGSDHGHEDEVVPVFELIWNASHGLSSTFLHL
jgi:hypothetical protein